MMLRITYAQGIVVNNLLTRNVGDVYECSDEKATELNKLGFVEFAEPKPKEETKK